MKLNTKDFEKYRAQGKVSISELDSGDTSCFPEDKEDGKEEMTELKRRLSKLQEHLYGEGKHKILTVFQAMDTAGKDGVVKDVFNEMSPQGIEVSGFKAPSSEELSRDYLWRAHNRVPGKGKVGIFIRSHYEDVLVVRVHELVPKAVWSRRYEQINDFERMLAEEGTTILKFFLNISKNEQKRRLEARIQDHNKNWKFSEGDLAERKLWPEYMKAYGAVLEKTSTKYAPWYIIPSDKKWYRNLAVASILINSLESLNMKFLVNRYLDKLVID
jgi:PPK2 family polyphosphate:nucleotide phosphotransferase